MYPVIQNTFLTSTKKDATTCTSRDEMQKTCTSRDEDATTWTSRDKMRRRVHQGVEIDATTDEEVL